MDFRQTIGREISWPNAEMSKCCSYVEFKGFKNVFFSLVEKVQIY